MRGPAIDLTPSFRGYGCRSTQPIHFLFFVIVLSFPAVLYAQNAPGPEAAASGKTPVAAPSAKSRGQGDAVGELVQQISESGRILEIANRPSDRADPPPEIAPGVAPVLSFRSLDRQARYRLGRLDLVVDDAGH
jgi:hypothetical protein